MMVTLTPHLPSLWVQITRKDSTHALGHPLFSSRHFTFLCRRIVRSKKAVDRLTSFGIVPDNADYYPHQSTLATFSHHETFTPSHITENQHTLALPQKYPFYSKDQNNFIRLLR